jgi:phage RecT family recombinase
MTTETKLQILRKNIKNNTEKFKMKIKGTTLDIDKFQSSLSSALTKNVKLQNCNNFIQLAHDVASFGLYPDTSAQHAHIIPFKNSAKLIIGYRGYLKKLDEAGYFVDCELVTKTEIEEGRFKEIRGTTQQIIHEPIRSGIRDRNNIAAVYCIIRHKDPQSNYLVSSVISIEEINEMVSKDKGSVWSSQARKTDYGQMVLKTAIRNCVKKVALDSVNEMSNYEAKRDEEADREPDERLKPVYESQNLQDAMQQIQEPEPQIIEAEKVDEWQGVKQPSLLDDYKDKINNATNKMQLVQIAAEISDSGMGKADKEVLAKIYSPKLKLLKND